MFKHWTKAEMVEEIGRLVDAMFDAIDALEDDESEDALDILYDVLGIAQEEEADEELENPDAA